VPAKATPKALHFTDDAEANALIATDAFALLMGFAIDQQVPVQKAFSGPLALKQRTGTLDPEKLAKLDLEEAFREKPAIHRFPGAMAERVRELAAVVAEEYGGDASRIWSEAKDTDDLKRRLASLPGFGPMKVTALGSVLALRYGLKAANPLVPEHPCLGGVDSPEALAEYQASKRAHKAALRAAATTS
jgi:uncharacterized HhH-GPD family protein